MAIKALEDNPITNAGYGSNLTIEGDVECDATIVDHYGRSGAAGAVSKVRNPISLARLVLDASTKPMLLSRVPPNLLVGQGATDYAAENGMMIFHSDILVSDIARARWKKWHQDLREAEGRHQARQGIDHVSVITSTHTVHPNEEASAARHDRALHPFSRSPTSSASSLGSWSAIASPSRHSRPLVESAADTPAVETPDGFVEHPGVPWKRVNLLTSPVDTDVRGKFTASARAPLSPSLKVDGHERGISPLARSGERTPSGRLKRLKLRLGSKEPQDCQYVSTPEMSVSDPIPVQSAESDDVFSEAVSAPSGIEEKLEVASSPEMESESKKVKTEGFVDGAWDFKPAYCMPSGDPQPCKGESRLDHSKLFGSSPVERCVSDDDCVSDTVGAIAVDSSGRIAAASSSGGIGMKHKGRAGPAALVGIGTAVIPVDPDDPHQASVAAVTSGTGEHMATTMAAWTAADRIYSCLRRQKGGVVESTDEGQALRAMIDVDFMGHPGVANSPCTGALGVMAVKRTKTGIYLYFGHNTDSFAIASMSSDDKKPRSVMSRNHSHGSTATGARSFRSREKPIPTEGNFSMYPNLTTEALGQRDRTIPRTQLGRT
ncbi:MAG: hypothetical protein Q9227_004489 [Pyrenula ochraceoflavens]